MIVCPGVYDGFSARIALEVGFDALYMVRYLMLFPSFQHRYYVIKTNILPVKQNNTAGFASQSTRLEQGLQHPVSVKQIWA